MTISARAVAWDQAPGIDCMYGLDPTGVNAILINGNGININAPNCGIMDNSDASSYALTILPTPGSRPKHG